MSHPRGKPVVEISDEEYARRKAAAEAKRQEIEKGIRGMLANGENIDGLKRKADQLDANADGLFRRKGEKVKPKKSFLGSLFCCFPCGKKEAEHGTLDEKRPLLGQKK